MIWGFQRVSLRKTIDITSKAPTDSKRVKYGSLISWPIFSSEGYQHVIHRKSSRETYAEQHSWTAPWYPWLWLLRSSTWEEGEALNRMPWMELGFLAYHQEQGSLHLSKYLSTQQRVSDRGTSLEIWHSNSRHAFWRSFWCPLFRSRPGSPLAWWSCRCPVVKGTGWVGLASTNHYS